MGTLENLDFLSIDNQVKHILDILSYSNSNTLFTFKKLFKKFNKLHLIYFSCDYQKKMEVISPNGP
jgi:hypothetical protein